MYPKLCYKEPCYKGFGVIAHHHCLHVNFVHMHNADIPNLKLFILKLYIKKNETQVLFDSSIFGLIAQSFNLKL